MKQFITNNRLMVSLMTVLWLKTFIVSTLTFDLPINRFLEMVVFIVNPLAFLLIVFSIGLLFSKKMQPWFFFITSALISGILYGNAVHYREFLDIITLPMLVMGGNMGDLSTSIAKLLHWYDPLFFIDLAVIGYLYRKKTEWFTMTQVSFRKGRKAFFAVAVIALTIVASGQVVQSEERAHSFNRDNVIKSMGLYNFYVYDAYIHLATATQTVFSEKDDWTEIQEHLEESYVEPNQEFQGIAEGRNVVMISLESVEDFVINETLNGEEITPFLNELIEDSFYFDNVYDQTGQGKTSDAEFMMHNSLYPLGRGAVFHAAMENEFHPLLKQLGERGYESASFHANDITFYNRDLMYEQLYYDFYIEEEDYDITDDIDVGWGMLDIDFFEQSMPYLEDMDQPFFAKFLTLTNHFPYELNEENHFIDRHDSDSEIVNRYFPTVRYTDEAIRLFFEDMKDAGLYDDTIFVLYGDHYGIAETHYEELSSYLGYEVTPDEAVKLDQVPVIIHIPGEEDVTFDSSTVGGQVDVLPTVLNLMGIDDEEMYMFGSDLLAEDRDEFAVLRNGDVVTDEVIYTKEICFDAEDGSEKPFEDCQEAFEFGQKELDFSDRIINGDLLRFDPEQLDP
ncbi:LTA synthase family protein [Salisediminibacterium beveridgei]|uniref:Lipoteichoic acid synthase LtaS Type IIIa n=1 Tax=Salisediminibacterium beveridgei TaxID=632773 RepID=A0A1D7QR39_9BACI|nr:LTA synthase family protein [Salisediminibacterium beveridgei]AOM81489.1 Lipoteichoic acid synthase LtaS Type IIIa [Salisediminibacterium beveridgei]